MESNQVTKTRQTYVAVTFHFFFFNKGYSCSCGDYNILLPAGSSWKEKLAVKLEVSKTSLGLSGSL